MVKRVLMVASVPSMIGCFNMNNIYTLLELGYKVDVACDFKDTSVWPTDRVELLKKDLSKLNIKLIQLDFSRSPFRVDRHTVAYRKVIRLIEKRQYLFIHTHTPIASAIVRMAARKSNTKVIYTAHGFHFYQGAPFINWAMFYPIERVLSRWTDVLITINKEDFKRAKNSFKAKKTYYVPGVGVDVDLFAQSTTDIMAKRLELGIPNDAIIVLSVGELSERKNHQIIVKALNKLNNPAIYYVIAGNGYLINNLNQLDKTGRLKLVGFRSDVVELLHTSDLFVFPSIQEGLPVALMEALAAGVPCIASNIRGCNDLLSPDKLVNPNCINDWIKAIQSSLNKPQKAYLNREFSIDNIKNKMKFIYKEI